MRLKLGRKGFSLVEVLIGITIMAVVAVPLAHAFITSARTSAKAQVIREETVAAQNILEAYEAADMATILTSGAVTFAGGIIEKLEIRDGGDWTEVSPLDYDETDTDGAGYRMTLTGIDGGEYDAVLTIVANERFGSINDKEIVDAKPMNIQINIPSPTDPNPAGSQNNNPDVLAAKDIALQATIDLLASLDEEEGEEVVEYTYLDFLDRMDREITIELEKGSTDRNITCTVQFNYSCDGYTPYIPPIDLSYADYDSDGNYGLFFFYYPNLNTALNSDIIEIYNQDNLEMNVYLILQGETDQEEPDIKLYETHGDKNNKMIALFANFITNYMFSPKEGFADYDPDNNKTTGMLGGTVSQNRIYEVTVDLYESGTDFEDPILSIDASSVE